MFNDIEKKVVWIIILLPGFFAVTIVGMIVDLGQLREVQLLFYSLALTFWIMLISFPVFWITEWLFSIQRGTRTNSASFVVIVTVITLLSGVGVGLAGERDLLFVTLRSLPGTDILNKRSSSRPLAFLLSQNSSGLLHKEGDARPEKVTEAWVRIMLQGGTEYEGWPEFYSLGSERAEIYLSPACRVKGTGASRVEKLPGPGVLLFEGNIRFIEFLDRRSSPCFDIWNI